MSALPQHAVYRLRTTRRDGVLDRRYRGTWTLSDDATKQVLATCDLTRAAVFGTHEIADHAQQVWRLSANRTIMPSRWLLTDPAQRLALQFHQQILRKLLNPWRRTSLALTDADGQDLFRLVDSRTGLLDRTFGPGTDDWLLMQDGDPTARLVRLPTEQDQPKGLLGRLGKMLSRGDWGIASATATHALAAPAALALLMLIEELTNPSGMG